MNIYGNAAYNYIVFSCLYTLEGEWISALWKQSRGFSVVGTNLLFENVCDMIVSFNVDVENAVQLVISGPLF